MSYEIEKADASRKCSSVPHNRGNRFGVHGGNACGDASRNRLRGGIGHASGSGGVAPALGRDSFSFTKKTARGPPNQGRTNKSMRIIKNTLNTCLLTMGHPLSNLFQEQPVTVGFTPLEEQQQQAAKSGTLNLADVDDYLEIQTALTPDETRMTVAAVAIAGIKAVEDVTGAIIYISPGQAERTVHFCPGAEIAAAFTAADAVSGTDAAAVLTFDNSSLNNDSVSNSVADGTGVSTIINALLATRKPSFSLQSLINGIESEVTVEGRDDAVLIFLDQAGNATKVLSGTEGAIESARTAAIATLAVLDPVYIDTTPVAETTRLYGE